jgi:hypothetical protein
LRLLDYARSTHEAYATFTSVAVSGIDPRQALAEYPGYGAYYEAARVLCGGLDPQRHLAGYHLAEIGLTECASAPLPARLLADGVSGFTLRQMPRLAKPDERFAYLRRELPALVPALLDRVDERLQHEVPGATETEPCRDWERQTGVDPQIEAAFADILRQELRGLLGKRGIPVLSSHDAEDAVYDSIRGALRHQFPTDQGIFQATRKPQPRDDFARVTESMVFGERLVFRTACKRVAVTSDAEAWVRGVVASHTTSVIALVASRDRLEKQYAIQWPGARDSSSPIVLLLDEESGEEPLAALCPAEYDTVDLVLRRLRTVDFTAIIMVSTMPEHEWWESWSGLLDQHGAVLYSDTNLVGVLTQDDGPNLRYAAFTVSDEKYVSGLVVDAALGGLLVLWLGSGVAMSMLLRLINGLTQNVRLDTTLAEEPVVLTALRYILNNESYTGAFQ